MFTSDNAGLFESILRDFDENGVLRDFILIGSWALRVYSEHFDNDPDIPIVATKDMDFLIPNPPKVSREVDISALMEKYELEEEYSVQGEYSKFVGLDFEVEFLTPEKGREQRFREFYNQMPKKWRKDLMLVLKKNNSELVNLLSPT